MKKRLEADLISIAHRILKLKNKSEIVQLHQETQKLYEKLTVLRFVEEHFSEAKPTIGQDEIFEKVILTFDEEVESIATNLEEEEKEVQFEVNSTIETDANESIEETLDEFPEEETQEETQEEEIDDSTEEVLHDFQESQKEAFIESIDEETTEEVSFEPNFDDFSEETEIFEKQKKKKSSKQISFEDLLGEINEDPIFEKIDSSEKILETPEIPEITFDAVSKPLFELDDEPVEEPEVVSNEFFKKGISFGLNDRIAFEKQLFGGSSEDLNRVVSQLSSFDSFEEAQEFIEDMVKPDYDNWEGKEDYVQRFMEIVEKKFA
jgi:hypothetical protein